MQSITAQITRKTFLTPDTIELELHYEEEFIFTPGQFISISIPVQPGEKPCRRSYSIVSSPTFSDAKGMLLCIKLVPGGQASEFFKEVKEGTSIDFLGPVGHFGMESTNDPKVLVATGTGIAPFRSMLETLEEQQHSSPLILLFGVRFEQDIFYKEWLDVYAARNPHFSYHIAVSRPTGSWQGFSGRVTDFYTTYPKDHHYYLCGNGAMIDTMRTDLQAQGIPREQLHFEKYFT